MLFTRVPPRRAALARSAAAVLSVGAVLFLSAAAPSGSAWNGIHATPAGSAWNGIHAAPAGSAWNGVHAAPAGLLQNPSVRVAAAQAGVVHLPNPWDE
jgi:hypothetical protein